MWKISLTLVLTVCAGRGAERGSWEDIRQVPAGQHIEIQDSAKTLIIGKFTSVSDAAITVETKKGTVSVERAKIKRVKVHDGSRRLRNAVIGGAIGAAVGLAGGLVANAPLKNEGNSCEACVAGAAGGLG